MRELLFQALELMRSVKHDEFELAGKQEQLPVYQYEGDPDSYRVVKLRDGSWRVEGESIERAAAMTYWEYDEAVRRFQGLLTRLGIDQSLRDAGAQTGDTVKIGEYELEWQD